MSIVDLIFPKRCAGCGAEGAYICFECRKKLVKPEPICPVCCRPSLDGWTHPRCRNSYGIDRLIVGLPYRGVVQNCLKKVKYKSSWDVINFLSDLQKLDLPEDAKIIAVPMYPPKEKERGFNQAEMIARLLAKRGGVAYLPMLERVRATKPMFGLTKAQRGENVRGAFKLLSQSTEKLSIKLVILVDDVWTTGATARECARVLKRGGVKKVWSVTLAR